jgi:hypothetical protein
MHISSIETHYFREQIMQRYGVDSYFRHALQVLYGNPQVSFPYLWNTEAHLGVLVHKKIALMTCRCFYACQVLDYYKSAARFDFRIPFLPRLHATLLRLEYFLRQRHHRDEVPTAIFDSANRLNPPSEYLRRLSGTLRAMQRSSRRMRRNEKDIHAAVKRLQSREHPINGTT